jgi:hypothetical protein
VEQVARLYHVTSNRNRGSISEHGLDWSRKSAARGIAGSSRPEKEGTFLCALRSGAPGSIDSFIYMNNTGGPVDVWAVDGIDERMLVVTGEGYGYFPGRIPPEALTLLEQDRSRSDLGPPFNP